MFGMVGAIGTLIVSSFFDVKWKKIPVAVLLAGGVWALVWMFMCIAAQGCGKVLAANAAAVLPGAAMIVISFLTNKKVGYGDGILLVILGIMEGIEKILLIFCVGLFLQSLAAVVLLLMKKADKQTCIPFVPFLLAAQMIFLIW